MRGDDDACLVLGRNVLPCERSEHHGPSALSDQHPPTQAADQPEPHNHSSRPAKKEKEKKRGGIKQEARGRGHAEKVLS